MGEKTTSNGPLLPQDIPAVSEMDPGATDSEGIQEKEETAVDNKEYKTPVKDDQIQSEDIELDEPPMEVTTIEDQAAAENNKLRSDEVNIKAKELVILAMELEKGRVEEEVVVEGDVEHQDTELQEKLKELTQLADCGSLDIALAIAAEEVLQLEG